MNERLIIQDRPTQSSPQIHDPLNLAKISVGNYLATLTQHAPADLPNAHRTILNIKKQTQGAVDQIRYHELVGELYSLLDETAVNGDVRVLK